MAGNPVRTRLSPRSILWHDIHFRLQLTPQRFSFETLNSMNTNSVWIQTNKTKKIYEPMLQLVLQLNWKTTIDSVNLFMKHIKFSDYRMWCSSVKCKHTELFVIDMRFHVCHVGKTDLKCRDVRIIIAWNTQQK